MKRLVLFTCFVLASTTHSSPLYAPTPPANSAFVRLVNTQTKQVGAYQVFKAGSQTLSLGGAVQVLQLEAGNFYTAVWSGKQWWVNQDRTASSLLQARVAVYNTSNKSIAVKTSDAKQVLWDKIDPQGYAMRPINPVKVRLAVFVDKKSLPLPETQLEANTAYSIFVFDDATTKIAFWVQNTTEVKP